MQLKSIKYSEWEGTNQEWSLERLQLGQKTLLVGRNASGKSRILNVIHGLSVHLLGSKQAKLSGDYLCEFEGGGVFYSYSLKMANSEVLSESLRVDGKLMLDRGSGGIGQIWAAQIDGGSLIDFQTPPSDLAIVARRDTIQHGFLEEMHTWASTVRYFKFGTTIGKENFAIFRSGERKFDERDQAAVVPIFRAGKSEFGVEFVDVIKADMAEIGYVLENVDMGTPVSVTGLPGEAMGMVVKESDLPGITDQVSMSQGMYRVLSLLIHVNYFVLKRSAACLLVDDIGEGLDFKRSCELITLLRKKSEASKLQILLSTNDRFVMNEVPLEEWAVLQREGSHVRVKNIENSKEAFQAFKRTGLSNFSFFEFDVLGHAAQS